MEFIETAISKSVVEFCKQVSTKFFVDEQKLLTFAKQFWKLQMDQTAFQQAIEQIASSQQNTPVSTPRATTQSTSSTPSTPRGGEETKLLKKKNKCVYVFKEGKNKGKTCDVSCVDKYCAKHREKDGSSTSTTPTSIGTSTAPTSSPAVDPLQTTLNADGSLKKRKMQEKKPEIKPGMVSEGLQTLVDQQKIKSQRLECKFEKNKWGNYWNEQTAFVYDLSSQRVVGKQREDGKVIALTQVDIELCKTMLLEYHIPLNLTDEVSKMSITQENEAEPQGIEDDDYENIESDDED
jgi:hypothetical protein